MKLTELDQKLRKNKEYDELLNKEDDYAFQISEMIIDARAENNLTQEQLAQKINTKQSSIARLENGNNTPSVAFLIKIANALGMKLSVGLVKKELAQEIPMYKQITNDSWAMFTSNSPEIGDCQKFLRPSYSQRAESGSSVIDRLMNAL